MFDNHLSPGLEESDFKQLPTQQRLESRLVNPIEDNNIVLRTP